MEFDRIMPTVLTTYKLHAFFLHKNNTYKNLRLRWPKFEQTNNMVRL